MGTKILKRGPGEAVQRVEKHQLNDPAAQILLDCVERDDFGTDYLQVFTSFITLF
jgi:hypothetical protein